MVDSPWECGVVPGSWGNSVGCCAGQCASGPILPAKKNESIGEFEVLLEDLSALLEDQPWPSRVVVAGDFNARSDSWDPGCRENARGRLLAEWTRRSGLILLNDKGHSTCVRPQGSSVVDLVWVTGIIRDRTTSCFVDDEESLSDHKTVSFHSVMMVAGVIPLHHLAPRLAEVYVAVRASGESVPLRALVVACMAAKRRAIADWKEEEIGLIGSGAPAYLFRIRRLESSRCFHCDEPFDDADHTLIACSCWAEQRGVLQSTTGRDISLPRVVGLAVRNPDKWRAFAQFAGEVMGMKEDEERRRERQRRVLRPGL
ncbi:hypothetical protein M0802_016932 [Mischocyttarus mexicanus]|nr:hypothetical protein M0802_016932 [Mischocyttarus mexicanus]